MNTKYKKRNVTGTLTKINNKATNPFGILIINNKMMYNKIGI
jgi:hypothetical protein